MEVIIGTHAYKHGLTTEQIMHAWENAVCRQHRDAPHEDYVVAIGFDLQGTAIQMVALQLGGTTLIYHAMSPVSKNVIDELGLKG